MTATKEIEPGRICYKIFDQSVCIESDVQPFIAYFERLYGHFLIADDGAAATHSLRFTAQGIWKLTIRRSVWIVPADLNSAELYAEKVIFDVFSQVESHYLFHAAVIACRDDALGLIGVSHRGKSTLAVALAQRGARLLSDETLAIQHSDNTITPHPRKVQLRQGSARLLRLPQPKSADGRFTLNLFPENVASARLRHLVFLEPNSAEPTPANTLFLWHSHCTPAWFAHIQAHPGITMAKWNGNIVQISSEQVIPVFKELEAQSAAFGVCIIYTSPSGVEQPDFSHSAEITPISRTQAANRLIAHYQNGLNSVLLNQHHKGDSGDLFMTIIRLLAEVESYVLTVGPLDEAIVLIESLRD